MPDFDLLDPAESEMAVLHAAFWRPDYLDTLRLCEADFYNPRRGLMWEALRSLHRDGIAPDAGTVTERLGLSGGRAADAAALLTQIVTNPSLEVNAEHHASIVLDRALRRRLNAATDGARQRINDLTRPVDEAVAYVEREMVGASSTADREADQLWSFDEFVAQPLPAIDWIIPNVMARDDRLILTGTEGAGKTTLMRTIAVMTAAGLNPFNLRSMPARKVLYVDAENPNRIMVQRFQEIGKVAARRGQKPTGLFIRRFPEGMDLGRPEQRMQLRHLCQAVQPDLLLIGPAYKLYLGGANSREEDLARVVASALDGLREEFGFALILEHHVPKGEGRDRGVAPIGSSLWMRWPEFGLGLKLDPDSTFNDRRAELVHWRGPRDERDWPRTLVSGGEGGVPWIDERQFGARGRVA